jgi:hypothetical protein
MVKILGVGLLAALIGFAAVSDWQSLLGICLAGFWLFVAALILYRREKQQVDGRWWSRILVAGLLVRVLAAFLHLAVGLSFYRGESDFFEYHSSAVNQAERFLKGHLIHIEHTERKTEFRPIEHLYGLSIFLVGPGIVGMVLFSALIGFIGCYLFLRAFRLEFPFDKDTRFLALALFFLPSVAFWGGYPGKDPWILLFLGWISYSFVRLLQSFRISHLLGIGLSLSGLILIRWPVGGVAALALGVTWLLKRAKGPAAILRPIGFAICPFLVVFILSYMGSFYIPQAISLISDLSSFLEISAETAALVHKGYAYGGSARAVEIAEGSLGGVLRYLPQGAFAFLFRPMIFEAHHGLAVAAALEATLFLALIVWRWRSLVVAIRLAFTKPFIGFCALTFIGLTAILAVESNFGTIVRHRAMVLPFLLILISVPSSRKDGREIS